MKPFLETNVYSFRGTVLLCGACLPEVAPEAFAALAARAEGCYALCLERDHLNLAVTKLTAILGTGQVDRVLFATVDRSPHCVQMHYMRHEIERVLPEHVPMESWVLSGGELVPVSPAAVELSKSLVRLEEQTGAGEALELELADTEWPYTYTDHDRQIVRAVVCDEAGFFYFVRATRNDGFGRATLIETSGGGVEPGEELRAAIRRELREELGAEVEIVRKLGIVSDYYNLIHRHNINHYYLCQVRSFGEKHLTRDEVEDFHLSTLRLRYGEALREYETLACTRIGRLIANRELPILRRAGELLGLQEP